MGSKHTRTGQYLLLYAAGFVTLSFMVTGCLHLPNYWQGQRHLATAGRHLAGGDYKAALEESQMVLVRFPADLADESLFQIGQIYAHPKNPDRDYTKSLQSFQRIVRQYPESRLQQDAKIWSSVIGLIIDQQNHVDRLKENNTVLDKQVKMQKRKIIRLQDQLEKLKRIDIKIEEKKREAMPQEEEIEEKENGKDSGRR
jgi:hypothetical protein